MAKIFVGNLPPDMDAQALSRLFTKAGTVLHVDIITDKYSGRSRGFGFVDMSSESDAQKAIATLNGADVLGYLLVVNPSRPLEQKTI